MAITLGPLMKLVKLMVKYFLIIHFSGCSVIQGKPSNPFLPREAWMLLQCYVTLTYFAYICSSRGKLWTFLSSLAWKVPNLIHLFVGYLENKQWS